MKRLIIFTTMVFFSLSAMGQIFPNIAQGTGWGDVRVCVSEGSPRVMIWGTLGEFVRYQYEDGQGDQLQYQTPNECGTLYTYYFCPPFAPRTVSVAIACHHDIWEDCDPPFASFSIPFYSDRAMFPGNRAQFYRNEFTDSLRTISRWNARLWGQVWDKWTGSWVGDWQPIAEWRNGQITIISEIWLQNNVGAFRHFIENTDLNNHILVGNTCGHRDLSAIVHLHSLPLPHIIDVEAKPCGTIVDTLIIPFFAPLASGDRITRLEFVVDDHRDLELEPIASPITNLGPNNTIQIAFMPGQEMTTSNPVEYHPLQITWSTPRMNNVPNFDTVLVRITRAPQLRATAIGTSAHCPGGTGSIEIRPTGGRPFPGNLYGVTVIGNNGVSRTLDPQASPITILGLSAGTYSITVFDRDSTVYTTESITLFSPLPAPVYNISVDSLPLWYYPEVGAVGRLAQGRLSVTPTNNNHSFSWSGEGVSAAGAVFFPPRGGVYTLTVGFTGNNGRTCTTQFTTDRIGVDTLHRPQTYVVRQPFCETSPTGILHAAQSQKDTLENSFFSWYENGIVFVDSTGDSLRGMLPGDYTLCINYRGAKSCTVITLSALDHITIQKDSIFHLLCHGASTGRVVLAVDGGTGNYIWDDIEFSSNTKEFTGLLAGTHTLTIKDQADPTNCMSEVIITLTQPDRITIRDSIEHIDCMGDSTGIVFFTVSGGTGGYTWVPGYTGNLTATSDSTFTFADIPEGSYTFTITDENKCSADIFVDVRVLSSPYLAIHNLVHHTILCVGQYHRPNPSPDTLRYVWTSISEPGLFFHERTPRLYSGIYVVRAFDEFNCFATDTITVISAPDTVVAQFWLNSDVFINEITTIVHVSYPVPDSALWVVPDNVEIISYRFEFIELIFHEQGEHTIGLIAYKGACIDYTETKVFVNGERQEEFLQDSPTLFDYAFVSPNPSRDYFELRFRTRRDADLLIQLFRANTAQQPVRTLRRNVRAYQTETETFSVQNLPPGTYILNLQTDTDRKIIKIIIL